jgi:two-component system, cell cycle sensor histidine kinase and response regulator CckA
VGILALRPHLGLVGVLLSNSLADTILRRLVPSIIIIVLAIELAHHLLNWERLFGSGFTSVVLIAATALVSVSIVYALERVDATRRENEARYRTLVDLSPHGIFVQQHERVVFHNSALSQLLHAPHSNALVGLSIWSLIHHDDHALVREQLNQMRQPGDHVPAVEQRWLRRDGELVSVEVTASAIRDVGQPAVLVVVHDISERKRLQAQLGHAQRMESIGRLAGGVAHDFNNLLSVIMGCTSLAAESLPTSHPVQGDLREIQAVSDRAKTLVRQLLLFARRQPTLPQQLDLNSMVRDIDRLLRHLLPKTIRLTYQLAPDLNNVLADASQLEQVLVNLVVNARDAMPQGGSLIVETANVMFDAASVGHYLGSRFGPHVMLAVSDTGVGMSAEVQQRAFEPFFSTKPPGEGTGLGLATCYGVVKQHGGTIWIYSEVGHGTTIKVYLPSVTGEVRDAVPSSDAVDVALQSLGHETVLLVEDAEEVRRVVARTLELYGYVVLQAADGNEALRLAALAERPASLLLTDVVMSDVNGYALAEALTGRWPGLRVLFMSGYTDAAAVQQGQAARGAAYLEKPFSPTALVRKVREVLDVY